MIGSGSAFCQNSEGPLGDPLPPAVQDPSLAASRYFPPSLITAGVANTGPALSVVKKGQTVGHGCNAANPCAVLSPALDRTIPVHAG